MKSANSFYSLFFILGATVFITSCASQKPLNSSLALNGTTLPKLNKQYGNYFDAPDGKILAVTPDGNDYSYRYGHCDIERAMNVALAKCNYKFNKICKVEAIGNNYVGNLPKNQLKILAYDYQAKIAHEHARLGTPSSIQKLDIVTLPSNAKASVNTITSGKVSADRQAPCGGNFQTTILNYGQCEGVWKNKQEFGSGSIHVVELDVEAKCKNGRLIKGVSYVNNAKRGLGILKSDSGDSFFIIIGETADANVSPAAFKGQWQHLRTQTPLRIIGDPLPFEVSEK